jgi:hypothetical protein
MIPNKTTLLITILILKMGKWQMSAILQHWLKWREWESFPFFHQGKGGKIDKITPLQHLFISKRQKQNTSSPVILIIEMGNDKNGEGLSLCTKYKDYKLWSSQNKQKE